MSTSDCPEGKLWLELACLCLRLPPPQRGFGASILSSGSDKRSIIIDLIVSLPIRQRNRRGYRLVSFFSEFTRGEQGPPHPGFAQSFLRRRTYNEAGFDKAYLAAWTGA